MTTMMYRGALVALVALAACGSEPRSFRIALAFDPDDRHGCDPAGCGAYGFECRAILGIRIENLATGRVVSRCRAVEPTRGDTMCALTTVDVSLGQVPLGRSRLSVAVWNPSQLAAMGGACPQEDIFDRQPEGVPLAGFEPRPAFGGAIDFDVGAEPIATVPLACMGTVDSGTGECPSTAVDVTVRDIDAGRPIEDGTGVNVAFIRPRFEIEDMVGPDALDPRGTWIFDEQEVLVEGEEGAPARWKGAVEPLAGGTVCVEVDRNVGRNAPVVTCRDLAASEELPELALDAWELDSVVLDMVLEASGVGDTEFEQRGLVVGRAMNADGTAPVAGVTVAVTGGTVGYIPDVPGTSPAATEQTGYFFSVDVPFGEGQWTATTDAQRAATVLQSAGLISGKVSVQVIRVVPR